MDDRDSTGTASKVATCKLREGRGTRSQVSAMWPWLQVQAQPVEAREIRMRRSQELLLRPMWTQFHAERQFTPSSDAESQLLSTAEEAMHSEDSQMKNTPPLSSKIVHKC